MSGIDSLRVFPQKITLSSEKSFFDRDTLTIAKNINDISNTPINFNLGKKIFSGIKRLSTLLFASQTGRIGISNRKENIGKYQESLIKLQKESIDNEAKLNNIDLKTIKDNLKSLEVDTNNVDAIKDLQISKAHDLQREVSELNKKLEEMTKLKDGLGIEKKKTDFFISLIQNENSRFKDRYSFFHYLNELQRAESFCRKSKNETEKQIADVFKNILNERLERVEGSDIKKIYAEISSTYQFESTALDPRDKAKVLSHFSTAQNREKFLSKINFLILLSEKDPKIMSASLSKQNQVKLFNIMDTILSGEDNGIEIRQSDYEIRDAWILKYMNEFYESKPREVLAKNEVSAQKVISTSTDASISTETLVSTDASTSMETSVLTDAFYDENIAYQAEGLNSPFKFQQLNIYENVLNLSNLIASEDSIKFDKQHTFENETDSGEYLDINDDVIHSLGKMEDEFSEINKENEDILKSLNKLVNKTSNDDNEQELAKIINDGIENADTLLRDIPYKRYSMVLNDGITNLSESINLTGSFVEGNNTTEIFSKTVNHLVTKLEAVRENITRIEPEISSNLVKNDIKSRSIDAINDLADNLIYLLNEIPNPLIKNEDIVELKKNIDKALNNAIKGIVITNEQIKSEFLNNMSLVTEKVILDFKSKITDLLVSMKNEEANNVDKKRGNTL